MHAVDAWTLSALAVVLASWLLFGVALLRRLPRSAGITRRRDVKSRWGMLAQAAAFGLVGAFPRHAISPMDGLPAAWRSSVGIAIMLVAVLSTLLFVASVKALGRQWSLGARVLEDHQLVTGGPYSWIRHPIYAAVLGMMLATGAVLSQAWVLFGAPALLAAGTLVRIRTEERLLRETFGAEWDAYASRVGALVPHWRGPVNR